MPKKCRFYHEDTYRRKTIKECRLIARNPRSAPWKEGLCKRCPVPQILARNPCAHLALEATIQRWLRLFSRVQVYAVCTARLVEIKDPASCGQGCTQYKSAF
ncbi:MAG: hypothetical protein ACE5LG_06045 [Anaerolineae bacterium]